MISFCKLVKKLGSLRGVKIEHIECDNKYIDVSFQQHNREMYLQISISSELKVYCNGIRINCSHLKCNQRVPSGCDFQWNDLQFNFGGKMCALITWSYYPKRPEQPENGVRWWG